MRGGWSKFGKYLWAFGPVVGQFTMVEIKIGLLVGIMAKGDTNNTIVLQKGG